MQIYYLPGSSSLHSFPLRVTSLPVGFRLKPLKLQFPFQFMFYIKVIVLRLQFYRHISKIGLIKN